MNLLSATRARPAGSNTDSPGRELYESLPVPVWVEDYSAVRRRLQELERDGVTDLAAHLAAHPELGREVVRLVTIVEVNQAVLDRYGFPDRATLVAGLDSVYGPSTVGLYMQLFCQLMRGALAFSGEDAGWRSDGTPVHSLVSYRVAPGCEESWERVFCTDIDVSRRIRAEETLVLQRDVAMALGTASDLDQALAGLLEALTLAEAFDAGAVFLRASATAQFELTASHDMSAAYRRRRRAFTIDEGLMRQLASGTICYAPFAFFASHVDDGELEPLPETPELRATALLPVVHDGEVLAVLLLASRHFDEFWPDTRRAIESAAAEIGGLLARVHAQSELRLSLDRMEALLAAGRAVNSTLDYDHVLQEITRHAGLALDVCISATWEYIAETHDMAFRAIWQREVVPGVAQRLAGYRPSSDDPLQRYRHLPEEVFVETVSDPELSAAARTEMEGWGVKTWMFVPLRSAGESIGVMVLTERDRERIFSPTERAFARALGDQASSAMHNAQLHGRLRAQLGVGHDVLDLSRALLSIVDAEGVFERVASSLASLVDYSALTILRANEAAGELEVLFAAGADAETMRGQRLPLSSGVASDVLRRGQAEIVNDMLSDPRAFQVPETGCEQQASIFVPIRLGRDRALLTVDRLGGGRFNAEQLETVQLFANLAAIALENARLYQTIEQQATRDGLTGLYNHRYLYERLELEIARAQRSGEPLSLLMIDLDDFKKINDRHGHPAGDRVLRAVANVLTENTRRGVDFVARFGGEEFAVITPGLPADRGRSGARSSGETAGCAAEVAARIRAALSATIVPAGSEDDLEGAAGVAGNDALRVTVSVGVAGFPETATSMDELVRQADAALYVAKRLGKDRTETYCRERSRGGDPQQETDAAMMSARAARPAGCKNRYALPSMSMT
jgi:diguanylate cyclase (GGDEF)-like protein